jgi:NTE family protein
MLIVTKQLVLSIIFVKITNMKRDVALVLSSGGARGIAHIGVIKTLLKHDFNITSIAGTSMGALVGGLYSTGQLDKFEDWLINLDKRAVLGLVDFTISSNGLLKGEKIIKELEGLIPNQNIEDLKIPFCAVATDILNEKEVVFKTGKLYDAIRASISIPTVFKPYKIEDRQLVDGGVLNPIPTNRVSRNRNDLLFIVDVNSRIEDRFQLNKNELKIEVKEDKMQKTLNAIHNKLNTIIPDHNRDRIGYFNLINRSTNIMLHIISEYTLDKYPPDMLISISRQSFGTYDFYKAADIIKNGELATEMALKELENN